MKKLLTRSEFKEKVFARDKDKCIVCFNPGVDAHHLLDRSLFADGGYYISNGVTLCSDCHIDAEKGLLTVEQLREAAKIKEIVLPPQLVEGVVYDKWGVSEDFNAKFPRILHSPISLGTTSDDRIFSDENYLRSFEEEEVILTEKLDGQNNSFNKYGVYARSHAAPTELPWDKVMVQFWESIKNDLGDIELFGESMFAIHSIEYKKLENYLYLFGVRQNGIWLSWEEVQFWAKAFDLPTVPQIPIKTSLKQIRNLSKSLNDNTILNAWLGNNLGMSWVDYTNTAGQLGGIDPKTNLPVSEGFVIRRARSFKVNEGLVNVKPNEFDSIIKLVRAKHVKTDAHWTKNWKPAKLKWENNYL